MTTETGSATITIDRPAADVFAAVSNVENMGDWSPENTGSRWLDGAGAALGSRFVGDNEAKLGPLTLKKWTTTSEVTAFDEPAVFEFVSEGTTTWRYEIAENDGRSTVTESVAYPATTGFQKVLYNALGNRRKQIIKGMEQTLAGLKASLEG